MDGTTGIDGIYKRSPFSPFEDVDWSTFRAKTQLNVVIVGAGIAGLTAGISLARAGHKVTVLESVAELKEVGAGIQIAPNASRILGRLNLLTTLQRDAVELSKISLRRWQNNEELGTTPLMPAVGQKYNAPVMVVHRADLQRVLLDGAKAAGVDIRLCAMVVKCDERFSARVQLSSGEWVYGDIVVAADGIKSVIRGQMARKMKHEDVSVSTGDAAYRVVISEDKIRHDKEAMKLLKNDSGIRWMGLGGHIMAYPVKSFTEYNMVLLHPQRPTQSDDESWTSKGSKKEMLEHYTGWNDTVRHLLSFVPEGDIMEWTLNTHGPLPGWVDNRVALMGDSCHPMLPYVAQGAAQAMEDAAVLTIVLSLISSSSDIPTALRVYETARKSRSERIQMSASITQKMLHLPDGPEQQERDRKIRDAGKREDAANPDLWSDLKWQNFMWGVDVMRDVYEGWQEEWDRKTRQSLLAVSQL